MGAHHWCLSNGVRQESANNDNQQNIQKAETSADRRVVKSRLHVTVVYQGVFSQSQSATGIRRRSPNEAASRRCFSEI
jgi:hypothetical protein